MRAPFFVVLLLLSALPGPPAPEAPDDMVLVPAGEFLMGAPDGHTDEAPAHRVYVPAFYIDRHEVTNAAFARFVRQSGRFDDIEGPWFRFSVEGCIDVIAHYERRYGAVLAQAEGTSDVARRQRSADIARWRAAAAALRVWVEPDRATSPDGRIEEFAARPDVQQLVQAQATLPARNVTWRDAVAFAHWAGKRLPTEAEWEKAARGTDSRRYPWGTGWDSTRVHAGREPEAGPVPVGSRPTGASPYGALDMAGNVWEWVADWYDERYYGAAVDSNDPTGPAGLADGRLPSPAADIDLLRSPRQGRESTTRKVIRGGAWSGPEAQARFQTRSTRRLWSNPSYWHPDVGFRCAKDPT